MRKDNYRKAQSILEYVVVLTALVGLIIYGASQWISAGVTNSMNNANTAITNAAGKL